MVKVIMEGDGGVLDSELCEDGKAAAEAAAKMILDAGELFAGDRIVVVNA